MKSNTLIRWSTMLAVIAAAIVAGWASYIHAYDVVTHYGETGLIARLYPGTVDGLVYSASMVMLDAARRGTKPHPLARWLLVTGITATLSANIWAGWQFGIAGSVIAAWPAPALVGSYELLMLLIRGNTRDKGLATAEPVAAKPEAEPPKAPPNPSKGEPPAPKRYRHAAGHPTKEAAEAAFQAELARGDVPDIPLIQKRLHVGKVKAEMYRVHFELVTRALR